MVSFDKVEQIKQQIIIKCLNYYLFIIFYLIYIYMKNFCRKDGKISNFFFLSFRSNKF